MFYKLREWITAQKIKFSFEDFFSKCGQIRSLLRIWSQLLKKSLVENSIFCVLNVSLCFKITLLLVLDKWRNYMKTFWIRRKKNKKKQPSLGHHFVLMFLLSVPIFRCSNDGYESWRLNAMYWYFLKYPLKDRGVCRTLSDNCDRTFFTVYKTDLQQRRWVFQITTAWKVSKYVVISGPYFPVFGLNTSPYSIRIQGNTDQK